MPMDLSEIISNAEDQDRGRELEVVDPVTGVPVGIRLRLAGPDSATQHRAQLKLYDELAEMAGPDGRVSAENRERARIACLARCVLGWDILEDGQPIPCTHANVLRVLRASRWLQAQVDAFAADRRNFMGGL